MSQAMPVASHGISILEIGTLGKDHDTRQQTIECMKPSSEAESQEKMFHLVVISFCIIRLSLHYLLISFCQFHFGMVQTSPLFRIDKQVAHLRARGFL